MAENERATAYNDAEIKRDENLPIEELVASMNGTAKKIEESETDAVVKEAPVEEEKLSPLEQLRRQQAADKAGAGMVLSNKELEDGSIKPVRDMVHTDERLDEFQQHIDELDDTLNKRNAVTVIVPPTNYAEYIQLIDEIESLEKDGDGKLYFNLKDKNGNRIEPSLCRLRNEDEAVFDFSSIEGLSNPTGSSNTEESSDDADSETEKEDNISAEKRKIVEVLIDKTGLGTDFKFTDEEKEKLTEAETIRINEVKLIDINAIRSKRSEKSFQDVVNKYDTSGSRVTICFPASGFKAQMKGLTYGEYADVSLSMDTVTFDQYYKRLSIIYNKMTNISTGPFENFEEFLKHFAYTDIQLALYAMYVATEKENQDISLSCGNQKCHKSFNWSFTTRSVLRLDRCADTFLKNMNEIATAPAMEYDAIKEKAAVNNSKYIELPDSKFICEMGIASAYDFLYNFIPLMNEDTFKDAFGDDVNEIYQNNILLLTSIRSVLVPDGEGNYITCTGYKDILDAIYNVSPIEIQMLAAYVAKIQTHYEMTFSFGDVRCPHCNSLTHNLDITMDQLVFQTYNRLMSTEIDLSKVQDL